MPWDIVDLGTIPAIVIPAPAKAGVGIKYNDRPKKR